MQGPQYSAENEIRELWRGSPGDLELALMRRASKITEHDVALALSYAQLTDGSSEVTVLKRFAVFLEPCGFTDGGLVAYGHMLMDYDEELGPFLAAVIKRAEHHPEIWDAIRPKTQTRLHTYVVAMQTMRRVGRYIPGGIMMNYVAHASRHPELDPHSLDHESWPPQFRELLKKIPP